MLRDVGLFDDAPGGWTIHNYLHRQELATVTETKRAAASMAGRKSQCLQRHGADCGCWENAS